MKKASEVLTKRKLLVGVAFLAILSGTIIVSVPNVAADVTSSILSILKSIQTIVQSIQTTIQNTNNDLNNVKVETVIIGPPMNMSSANFAEPRFNITANQPWDLMAVYITTGGVGTVPFGNQTEQTVLRFGYYQFGSRRYFLGNLIVAEGHDATDSPIFAGDMTNGTQSVIPVPANVSTFVAYDGIVWPPEEGFLVTFKIVIQRPIDPSFSYTVTWG